MLVPRLVYDRKHHAAVRTSEYLFNQLIPYIGNKRKLLGLIHQSIGQTSSPGGTLVDFFAGSGVVARLAKLLGYRVVTNDWEPYAEAINRCYIACNRPPAFESLGGYKQAIETLNALPPSVGWVTEHLCPRDDDHYDIKTDRMFYMRRNGMRIDAIREQIAAWKAAGQLSADEQSCLLTPLVYQACYRSNTSGVFKGFHNGWGGQTRTALYRIATDLHMDLPVFWDNGQANEVCREDAQSLAERLSPREIDVAYLDPPYNQHPYGSNYHVLNSIVLWDKPPLSKGITRGTKAAIRLDWRTERRSAYNYREEATAAYRRLLATINARYILTSYSTDGTIPLEELLKANVDRGHVSLEMQGYKRYRVSTQRFSKKPMNVEFVLIVDTHRKGEASADELVRMIREHEDSVLCGHSEHERLDPRQRASSP
ncbi:MAG: DNA adenine methylase [Planctomycetaceae bacterium]|nr:DNA adenine methylase [Planctomycetaceae bacterium]